MSKCQMRKYLPGGSCVIDSKSFANHPTLVGGVGSGSNPCVKENTSQTSQAFNQLMAAREAQDKLWTQPSNTQTASNTLSHAIIVAKPKPQEITNKKEIISIILGDDF